MPRNRESALQTKVVQIVFGLGLLGIVVFATKSMMFGSTMIAKALTVAIVGTAVVFALDRRYWLLSAFLFGFYNTIPHLKFTGTELGALLLISISFVRMALQRDKNNGRIDPIVVVTIPFMAWFCLVWAMNPTGLLLFGSSRIGGRFYFRVVLAFLSLFVLSKMKFDNDESKQLVCAVVMGYVVQSLVGLCFRNMEYIVSNDNSHYVLIPFTYVAPLFLCRFSASEILSRPWLSFGFMLTFFLGFWSGNRTGATRPILVGLLAPFFLRRDRLKTIVLMFFASFVLLILVLGQGNLWRLPFAIQRPLSFLPGKWDRKLEQYGFNDNFRATLRMYAREHIRANPWFGDGGFSLDSNEIAWSNAQFAHGDAFSGHVAARNWHNVWLGMAADFGIPLSVFWGLFMAVLLISGWRDARRMPPGSWNQTAYLYFYLLIIVEFVSFFFAGGHTARTTETIFLWTGMMTAVKNGGVRLLASS